MDVRKINEKAQGIARQVAEVAGMLWDKGWGEATSGNISVNATGAFSGINLDYRTYPMVPLASAYPKLSHHYLFITTKGSRMRDLRKDPSNGLCIIKISKTGEAYQVLFEDPERPLEPSSELLTHLAIHNQMVIAGNGNQAIVHAHVHELVSLTHKPDLQNAERLNEVLMSMHTETPFFLPEGIGYVPLVAPGSPELAEANLLALQDHTIVVWEKHGCMAIGKDVHEAFDRIDVLAKAANIYLLGLSFKF
jgi:rhamnulose-1-phosphate aldolase